MLETVRNVGRVLVGTFFGFQGLFLLVLGFWSTLALVDFLKAGDFDHFMTQMIIVAVLGGGLFFLMWMAHDAQAELKNIQIQKEQLKELEPKDAPMPEVPTKEPWLYP